MISSTHPYPTMRFFSLLLFLALVAPLAHAQKDASKPDDVVVGTWNYTVPMPQQTYEGTFTITATDDGYTGEFVSDTARRMTTLEVDGATAMFEFEQPGMGKIAITGTVDEEDVFKGQVALGPDITPITATREPAEELTEAMVNAMEAGRPSGYIYVAGTWGYTLRPDDVMAQGTFEIEWDAEALDGAIQTDGRRKFDAIELDGDRLMFSFTQPGMGVITITGTITGDEFDGEAQPAGSDPIPFVATRQ